MTWGRGLLRRGCPKAFVVDAETVRSKVRQRGA
jgi:hypothetical protein